MHIYYTHVYDIKQDKVNKSVHYIHYIIYIPFHIFLLIHQSLINLSFVLICCVF